MRLAIIGADGRLGSALMRKAQGLPDLQVTPFTREDFDALKPEQWRAALDAARPEAVINCAAYNSVDGAEADDTLAIALNVEFPKGLAGWAAANGACLVHYSSGYVFDGSAGPYAEDAEAEPISAYGRSKLRGEQAIAEALAEHYVIRLNLLFGGSGTAQDAKPSFTEMVLAMAGEGKPMTFVDDEFSSPTYSDDLAEASLALLLGNHPFGTYHLSNSGQASWLEFAEETLKDNGMDASACRGISSESLPRKAARPRNSALLNTKYPELRDWKEAMAAYYNKMA